MRNATPGNDQAHHQLDHPAPAEGAAVEAATPERGFDGNSSLFDDGERREFRDQWDAIQARFVDDPRAAAADADELFSEAMARMTARWEHRHDRLLRAWRDGDGSTEHLRLAVRDYRDVLERMVSS